GEFRREAQPTSHNPALHITLACASLFGINRELIHPYAQYLPACRFSKPKNKQTHLLAERIL
ncbi:MAG: hypothetical protein L6437_01000, partial [Kiritimatiellae bacterium]|nr:hypothetical protein [Kiritimatiellia bacterium]